MELNPLLAYPLACIDPSGTGKLDEGEARLRLLRPALRMAGRSCTGLCDADADASFAALIAGSNAQRAAVHAAVFKADAAGKPRVALAAPTAKAVMPSTADAFPEDLRVQCVPILGDESVAVLHYPAAHLPAPKLTLDFSRRLAGADVHVCFKRGKAAGEMSASIFTSSGGRKTLALSGIDLKVLDRLFAPMDGAADADSGLMPTLPGELPVEAMGVIADFWQRQMRCHVVAAACAPADATRPLAFERIVARREGSKAAPTRATIRATLHPSSVKCACALHGLASMPARFPSERFVDSSVELTLAMCGRALGSSGVCPLHGNATPTVSAVPGVCCAGTTATLGCSHVNSKKRRRSGLFIPDLVLEGANLLHAQTLLSGAMQCTDKLEPMLGKKPREAIERACDPSLAWLDRSLDELERRRAVFDKRSASDMLALDILAVDALRAKDVRRHVRPSTKQEILVRERCDGAPQQLSGPEGALCEAHMGLFRPVVKTRRS